jgi:hypothetical protein
MSLEGWRIGLAQRLVLVLNDGEDALVEVEVSVELRSEFSGGIHGRGDGGTDGSWWRERSSLRA